MADPTGGASGGTISRLGLVVDANGMVTGSAHGERALTSLMATADQTERRMRTFSEVTRAGFDTIGTSARSIGTDLLHFGAGFVGLFGSFKGIEKFVEETSQAQDAQAQLVVALNATGGASGRSAEELSKMAEQLQKTTTFTDDAIKSAETMLTTFTKIRGNTFDEATVAATNLAQRLGGDVVAAAQLVGKALQEPDQGLAQLNRQFRLFSQNEQDAIKQMVLAGDAAGAQAEILKRLEDRFGGAAEAARGTLGGALKGVRNDFADLFKADQGSTTGLVGGIHALDAGLVALKPHIGEVVTVAEVLGTVVAGRWISGGVEALAGMAKNFTLARAEGSAYLENSLRVATGDAERTAILVRQATVERAIAVERAQNAVLDRTALVERAAAINGIVAADAKLVAANSAAAASERALAVATTEASLAARTAAGGTGLFTAALAPFGGPVGVAIIATIFAIKHAFDEEAKSANKAKEEAENFKRAAAGLTNQQLIGTRAALEGSITGLQGQEAPFKAQIAALPKAGTPDYDVGETPKQLAALTAQLTPLVQAEQALQAQLDATSAQMQKQGLTADGLSQAVKDTLAQRDAEIGKLRALNDAYGASEYSLKLIALQQDANIKKAQDAKDHTDAERQALDAATDAMLHQQQVAARNEQIAKDFEELAGKAKDWEDQLHRNKEANDDLLKSSNDSARLARVEGYAREYLQAQITAENQAIEAARTLHGRELDARLQVIDAVRKQSIETANLLNWRKLLADAQAGANHDADINIQRTRVETSEVEKLSAAIEKDLYHGISQFASHGVRDFKTAFEEIGSVSLRTVGSIDSGLAQLGAQLRQTIDENTKAGIKGATEQTRYLEAQIAKFRELRQVAAAAATVVTAGLAGYNFAQQSPSTTGGVIGGAISGAATGAQLLGPAGAVIGGLVGAAGGLAGAANAHREAAEQLRRAGTAIQLSLTAYGQTNATAGALTGNQATFESIRDALADQLKAALKADPTHPAGAFDAYFKQLQELEATRGKNAAKVSADFWASIQQQINATQGPAGAYANALTAIGKEYDANVASVLALHAGESDLTALNNDLAKVAELRARQEAQLTAAENERLAQIQGSLDAREAYAKGLTAEGDALKRRYEEEAQLFDAQQKGYSDAQLARLQYIQGLEDEAEAKRKATAEHRGIQDDQTETARLTATSQAARDLVEQQTLALQHERTLQDLKDQGASAEVLAAKEARNAAEDAALAWQQAVAAINRATSDIGRDVQLGFVNPQAAFETEKTTLGFGGLSIDQIKALYTPYAGTALTDTQEETNRRIDQLLNDFSRWFPANGSTIAESVANAVGGAGLGQRQAIISGVAGLSQSEGARVGDLISAMLTDVRGIRVDVHDMAGGAVLRPNLGGGQLADFVRTLQPMPLTPGQAATGTARAQSSAGGINMIFNIPITVRVVAADGSDARAFGAAVVRAVMPQLEAELANGVRAAQKKAGDTTILGA